MAVVTIPVTNGTTFYIAVDGEDASYGNLSLACSDVGGGGVSLPSGAVGIIDFVNGGALWGSTSHTLDEVTDHSELVIPGAGILIGAGGSGDPSAKLLIDFNDYLVGSDFTVVVEWLRLDTFAEPLLINQTGNNPRLGIDDAQNGSGGFLAYDLVGGAERDLSNATPPGGTTTNVLHALALTRTDAKIVVSLDGASVISETTAQPGFQGVVTDAWLGGDDVSNYGRILVGRIVIYPPQLDTALPGLAVNDVMGVPGNNDFANATTLTLGSPAAGHNFLATRETGEPDHAGISAANSGGSVWWKFTAGATQSVTLDTHGSGFDTGMAVYTSGGAVDALSVIAQNDDSGSPTDGTSEVTFGVLSGVTYYVAVDGHDTVNGAKNGGITLSSATASLVSPDGGPVHFLGRRRSDPLISGPVDDITIPNVYIGPAAANRTVILAVAYGSWNGNDSSPMISGVTLGGNAMTRGVEANGSGSGGGSPFCTAAFFYLPLASGEVADIVIDGEDGNVWAAEIAVYVAYGLSSSAPAHTTALATTNGGTGATSLTGSIDIPSGGFMLAVRMVDSFGDNGITGIGSTVVDYSDADGNFLDSDFLRRYVATGETKSLDSSWTNATDAAIAAASWAP